MNLTIDRFHQFAGFVGVVLTAMGVGLLGAFAATLVTDLDLAGPPLELSGPAVLMLGSVGAFALPLGLSLLGRDARASSRLRLAAGALGLMALLRLAAFLNPELRAVVGVVPLVEFFVLGGIALVAALVRPPSESPIELHTVFDVEASASDAWHVLAERFGDVAEYTSSVSYSTLDGPMAVGAVRTCETPGFGPFSAARVDETITHYHPEAMRFGHVASQGLPSYIPRSTSHWSIEPLGERQCRVRNHASIDLSPWVLPLTPLLSWAIRRQVVRSCHEIREYVERGAMAS